MNAAKYFMAALFLLIGFTAAFTQDADYELNYMPEALEMNEAYAEFEADAEEMAEAEMVYDEAEMTYDEAEMAYDEAEMAETAEEAPLAVAVEDIPLIILNNHFFLRSVALNAQAREAFGIGDYGASADYAEQAAMYALLSDAYVAMRLAEHILLRAHARFVWARSAQVQAPVRFPQEYQLASVAYDEALEARSLEDWDSAVDAGLRVIAALANITDIAGVGAVVQPRPLPAQYTVRRWQDTRDSFYVIAGWDWVYGNSRYWRILFEANRHRIPNPNNPNLILPGMIMDIPSLRGEQRSGMWEPGVQY